MEITRKSQQLFPLVKLAEKYRDVSSHINIFIIRPGCYSCHKNRMTERVITLWRVHVTSLTTSLSTMCFLIEIKFSLNAMKSLITESYDKQNLILMVISYETRRRLVL